MQARQLCLILSLAFLISVGAGAQQSAADIAQALQRKYESIRDFSADFAQTSESGPLKRKFTERGSVVIKKPLKMRWEYKQPEEKLVVSDGRLVQTYVKADRQVVLAEVSPTPALFLAGQGNMTRDFTPALVTTPPGLPAGTQALKLTPVRPQPEYEWMVVGLDPKTLSLRGLVFIDAQGSTQSIVFTNLKENRNPPDSRFSFTPPRGVQIIGADPKGR
jgi:outer membrane lipoprotein carrier protein